jgi:hypothetical protein
MIVEVYYRLAELDRTLIAVFRFDQASSVPDGQDR